MFGVWSIPEITQAIARSLEAHALALDAERAVRGLDALSEVEFHPIIARGLESLDLSVWREWPYPSFVGTARQPLPRDRERCDLVLAPAGIEPPADPIAQAASRRAAAGSLFEGQLLADLHASDAPEPEDLFWLEIKIVGQHVVVDGAERANAQYSSELVQAGRDLEKLASDPRIALGGLALIHFTADKRTAEHDQGEVLNRWLDRGWPVRNPESAGFALTDRIANQWCSVMLTPVRP